MVGAPYNVGELEAGLTQEKEFKMAPDVEIGSTYL